MDTCWRPVCNWLAVLTTLLFCSAAKAAPSIAPLEDRTVAVGELVQVRVQPQGNNKRLTRLRLLNPPSNALFTDNRDGTRTFLWIPREEDTGMKVLQFEITDNENGTSLFKQHLQLKIVYQNGSTGNIPPTIGVLENTSVSLGETIDIHVVAKDPDGTIPTLSVNPLPLHAVFNETGNGTGQFVWTPDSQSVGITPLTFTATDADEPELSTQRTITLTVHHLGKAQQRKARKETNYMVRSLDNQAPYFIPIDNQAIALGGSFNFNVRAVDTEGLPPSIELEHMPPGATLTTNIDGSRQFNWRPMPADLGDTLATFVARDSRNSELEDRLYVNLHVYRLVKSTSLTSQPTGNTTEKRLSGDSGSVNVKSTLQVSNNEHREEHLREAEPISTTARPENTRNKVPSDKASEQQQDHANL